MVKIGTLLALLFLTASSAANADKPDPRWNFAGWTPSLTLALGLDVQPVRGFVIATNSAGDTIRPPQYNDKTAITPILHIALGLETPEIPRIPGNLRLFGSVDYFMTFPPNLQAASEGSPTGFVVPPGFQDPPEAAIEGQGSQTTLKMNRSAYGLTGGVSIPVNIGEFQFHIKPGVSWMRQEWNIKGVVLDAEKAANPASRDFRGIELRARGKLYSSGVGPYLAIDTAPNSLGPILVSAFVEAAYYRTLGDRTTNFTDSETLAGNNLPPDTYLGRWGIKVDRFFWRSAVGIRVYLAAD